MNGSDGHPAVAPDGNSAVQSASNLPSTSREPPPPLRCEIPDEQLVQRVQAGETAAFAQLVERYADRVYNTCYRMSGSRADAEDLTQATFLRAFQAIGRFEARSGFYTWLFRIAVNTVLSSRRRARVARDRGLGGDEGRGAATERRSAPNADPIEAAERREWSERVAGALACVDEEFRMAVILKDVEELDYAQIAAILAVPVGTVKSRIFRGRKMLRNLLRDKDS